jgi:hypothetical protein
MSELEQCDCTPEEKEALHAKLVKEKEERDYNWYISELNRMSYPIVDEKQVKVVLMNEDGWKRNPEWVESYAPKWVTVEKPVKLDTQVWYNPHTQELISLWQRNLVAIAWIKVAK